MDVNVISVTCVEPISGLQSERLITAEISGILKTGKVRYRFSPSNIVPGLSIYRPVLILDDSLVIKHPSYKEIRHKILIQFREILRTQLYPDYSGPMPVNIVRTNPD